MCSNVRVVSGPSKLAAKMNHRMATGFQHHDYAPMIFFGGHVPRLLPAPVEFQHTLILRFVHFSLPHHRNFHLPPPYSNIE